MTRATTIPDTVTLHVPFRVVKRGGRKEMVLPPGASTQSARIDNSLVKALARAFHWKRMLDSGEYATMAELARREGIAVFYLTRILGLTLLAPDIVEAILMGRQPKELRLVEMLGNGSVGWEEQRCAQGFSQSSLPAFSESDHCTSAALVGSLQLPP